MRVNFVCASWSLYAGHLAIRKSSQVTPSLSETDQWKSGYIRTIYIGNLIAHCLRLEWDETARNLWGLVKSMAFWLGAVQKCGKDVLFASESFWVRVLRGILGRLVETRGPVSYVWLTGRARVSDQCQEIACFSLDHRQDWSPQSIFLCKIAFRQEMFSVLGSCLVKSLTALLKPDFLVSWSNDHCACKRPVWPT